MKARIENGKIKQYGILPSKYKSDNLNIAGGFHKLSQEVHETEGFYNVIIPKFDEDLQILGVLFWDAENLVFTYPVEELVIDLEAEKLQRKAQLKQAVEDELMAALAVGALEYLILDGVVPQSYKDTVIALRTWEADVITQIDAFSVGAEIVKFRIKQEDVESAKSMLKSGRK